jgi:C-terminal, D2-small domain, of ClpB protein
LKFGARHLKRAIERNVVFPLANLLATEQVRMGDILCIDWDESKQKLVFEKEGEGAVLPVAATAAFAAGARAARATGGKAIEVAPAAAAREAQAPAAASPLLPMPAPAGRRKQDS